MPEFPHLMAKILPALIDATLMNRSLKQKSLKWHTNFEKNEIENQMKWS